LTTDARLYDATAPTCLVAATAALTRRQALYNNLMSLSGLTACLIEA